MRTFTDVEYAQLKSIQRSRSLCKTIFQNVCRNIFYLLYLPQKSVIYRCGSTSWQVTVYNTKMIEDTKEALQDIRRALIELYAAVDVDPTQPQEVARQLGLNRNLTWKLSRVMTAPDPFATLNHMPGQQGLDLALAAFSTAGATSTVIDPVNTAMKKLANIIDVHSGDRETLELTLESSGVFQREESAESGRELAFRGNSSIWGIRARTRLATVMVSKSADDNLQFAQLGGYVDILAMRPNVTWRLFHYQLHDDKGGAAKVRPMPEEIEPKSPEEVPLMLREFCSPGMPAIIRQVSTQGQGQEFLMQGGKVGKTGTFNCFFGYIVRGLPAYADENNRYASGACAITLPCQTFIFDLIVHRDVVIPDDLDIKVYGFPHGGIDSPDMQTVENLLPIHLKMTELVGSPPTVATHHVPRYSQLISRVYDQMGKPANEFRGWRVVVPYPPMSCKVVVRWKLPDPPSK